MVVVQLNGRELVLRSKMLLSVHAIFEKLGLDRDLRLGKR
jgi:hypothetical protein